MQIVRFAEHVGTMLGPDGHIHRWTAHREKIIQRVLNINASTKSLVERLCDLKINAVSVLGYIGSISAPDKVYYCRTIQCYSHQVTKGLRRSRPPERLTLHPFLRSASTGKRNFLLPPWLAAPRIHSTLSVV